MGKKNINRYKFYIMPSLKLQKRLAANILRCGKRKVWLDPSEKTNILASNSRKTIRKLIKNGIILEKPEVIRSLSRSRKNKEAKSKGRHMGYGKRHGTREARLPSKVLWIRHIRVLRRLLRRYRTMKKIDKRLYHSLYKKCKGNVYKNKLVLVEAIQKEKVEKARDEAIADQFEARRAKMKAVREKMALRREEIQVPINRINASVFKNTN